MTQHEQRLAEIILGLLRNVSPEQAVERLIKQGLINRSACEQRVICAQVEQLARQGTPRCEALHVAADSCCCSYEKARTLFYNQYKSQHYEI
ncbi:MAG: hypothetical protein RR199_01050 [Alistipes sp.]